MENPTKNPKVIEAGKRYREISDLIDGNENGVLLKNDLVKYTTNYVKYVANMEAKTREIKNSVARFHMSEDGYKDFMGNMDRARKTYHTSLMDALIIFNRYLFKNYQDAPVGGMYSLDPKTMLNREAVADWAGYLFEALEQQLESGDNRNI